MDKSEKKPTREPQAEEKTSSRVRIIMHSLVTSWSDPEKFSDVLYWLIYFRLRHQINIDLIYVLKERNKNLSYWFKDPEAQYSGFL